jgi:hypothetical protein
MKQDEVSLQKILKLLMLRCFTVICVVIQICNVPPGTKLECT